MMMTKNIRARWCMWLRYHSKDDWGPLPETVGVTRRDSIKLFNAKYVNVPPRLGHDSHEYRKARRDGRIVCARILMGKDHY